MSHGHDHNHNHTGAAEAGPLSPDTGHLHLETPAGGGVRLSRLRWAIGITAIVMAVEIAGGLYANSLALLSDAGHMLTHILALGISYFAVAISERPADAEKTFGYFRAEVLAAFANGLFLLAITGWIFYESGLRLIWPEQVRGMEMLAVAIAGLVANVASVLLLAGISAGDLNLKSAFMHVVYDTASSVAVVGCAVVVHFTGFVRLDPMVSAGIGILILFWCVDLLKESGNILLESTPKEIDLEALRRDVEQIPRVRHIHDIHAWEISSGMYVLSAHLDVEDMSVSESEEILHQVNNLLRSEYNFGHTTLQIESATPHPHTASEDPED